MSVCPSCELLAGQLGLLLDPPNPPPIQASPASGPPPPAPASSSGPRQPLHRSFRGSPLPCKLSPQLRKCFSNQIFQHLSLGTPPLVGVGLPCAWGSPSPGPLLKLPLLPAKSSHISSHPIKAYPKCHHLQEVPPLIPPPTRSLLPLIIGIDFTGLVCILKPSAEATARSLQLGFSKVMWTV